MALNLTGNSKRVRVHSSSSVFQATTALTILAWLRTTDKSIGDQVVFFTGGWGGTGGLIDCTQRHHDGGKFGFFLTTDTTQTQINIALPSDVNNKWYYYGLQVNFSDNLNDHNAWIGSQTAPAALQSNADETAGGTLKTLQTGSNTEPTVGSASDGSWGSFQGDIGFLAVYDALLTEEQVQWCQFNPTAFPGCMGMWNFGWPGTSAIDISGNGLSSTKYGTPTNVAHPYMPYSRQRKRSGFHFVAGPTVLTPVNVAHAHSVGAPSIVQAHQLGAVNVAHGHAVGTPSFQEHSQHAPQDVGHGHTVSEPTIQESSQLSADDVDHGHVVGEPAIQEQSTHAPDNVAHGHAVGEPSIAEQSTHAPEDVSHGHAVGESSIQEHSQHQPDDVTHGQVVDGTTLVQAHLITVDNVTHAHSVEEIVLVVGGVLTPLPVAHAHLAGVPSLQEHSQHQPEDVSHAHTVDAPTVDALYLLAPDDVSHTHAVTEPSVAVGNVLQALDAVHAHAAESPWIQEHAVLLVDSVTHAHLVGETVLVTQAVQVPGHRAFVLGEPGRSIKLPARGGDVILGGD